MLNRLLLILLLFLSGSLTAQSTEALAVQKTEEAIRLMDKGQIEESLKLLDEAGKLDPKNVDIPYEKGYAHYLAKDYEETIDLLTTLVRKKKANDLVFELLGNSYDLAGNRDKAIQTYEAGLKRLPKSGRLYLELGGMYLVTSDYDRAIGYFEKGIDVQPDFSSNYYHLAKIFLNSEEEVWGMIYGEIFMNLERNTARTAEISKLLYDTYKSEIRFTSDTSFTVSFSKNSVINLSSGKLAIPYGIGVYEPTLMMSMLNEKAIDLNSLDRIRTAFIENYFSNKNSKEYANVLFDFQNTVLKEGHLEAYNHWILMKGDEDGFVQWKNSNSEKWNRFLEWFNPNSMVVNNKNKFVRTQY